MSEPVVEVTVPPVEAEPEAQAAPEETVDAKIARLEKEAADTRREAAKYRTTAKENAAAASELEKIRDSQKTEAQKIQDRADAAEKRATAAETELIIERIARRHKIDDDDLDLLGSGTEEQIEARAKRIAAKNAAVLDGAVTKAPPSDKPVQKLRPGATGHDVPIENQQLYPAEWLPSGRAHT